MDPVLNEASEKITNTLEHLKKELASIRAGRANPTLIEDIHVTVYGSKLKLMEVGTIAAPQPSLLQIQVWDATIIKDVEKAIMEANIGLNPAIDGTTIRLPIPPLSEERRQEFVKMAHTKGESTRIELRQLRSKQREDWDKQKESGEIGEDELFRREKLLQELIDKSVNEVDIAVKAKEEELMQI